jgi:hypothetical protein
MLVVMALVAALLAPAAIKARPLTLAKPQSATAARAPRISALPLTFVANRGQTDARVRFVARGLGGAIFFTPREIVLSLPDRSASQSATVRLRFKGGNVRPTIDAVAPQASVANYMIGNAATGWQTNVPTYAGIVYNQLYRGVDLHYSGQDGLLKGTYIVAPGSDPRQIRWQYDGASRLQVAADGSLQITLASAAAPITLREAAPIAWQTFGGRQRPVAVRYRIVRGAEVRFELGAYDRSQPLTIDPTLAYSTYLGGGSNDFGYGIAVDSSGAAYIAGETASLNFPTASPLQGTKAGGIDAFVAKLNAAGTALVYSTYLGGSATDRAYGIAVDSAGGVVIVGSTSSTDFPTVSPLQASNAGLTDIFVARINAAGSALSYSTYLGGGNYDDGRSIALDSSGSAYITGDTMSSDFPTANAFQASFGGGSNDAIVAKLNASGSTLSYSTYLGGNDLDQGFGIAVDSAGQAVVSGKTAATNFPTQSPLQSSNAGSLDAFVTRLSASGSTLSYSTYLGGSGSDSGNSVALDSSDNIYLTGNTSSSNFPTASPIQASYAGSIDAFAAKINASGSTLSYSTYLGGGNVDVGQSIAVGEDGGAHLTGYSRSTNYPTASPLQATLRGNDDVIISSVNAAGSALTFSSYLGGSSQDWGYGIRIDSASALYITGYAFSTNFPTANPLQPARAGSADAIIAKITP